MPETGHFFEVAIFRRRAVNVIGLCGEFTKMEDWKKFYSSAAWKQARESYTKYRRGLCEICLSKGIIKAGEIVHHKRHLTAETVNDPTIALSFDNLQLLCRDCHGEQHRTPRRYKINERGEIEY